MESPRPSDAEAPPEEVAGGAEGSQADEAAAAPAHGVAVAEPVPEPDEAAAAVASPAVAAEPIGSQPAQPAGAEAASARPPGDAAGEPAGLPAAEAVELVGPAEAGAEEAGVAEAAPAAAAEASAALPARSPETPELAAPAAAVEAPATLPTRSPETPELAAPAAAVEEPAALPTRSPETPELDEAGTGPTEPEEAPGAEVEGEPAQLLDSPEPEGAEPAEPEEVEAEPAQPQQLARGSFAEPCAPPTRWLAAAPQPTRSPLTSEPEPAPRPEREAAPAEEHAEPAGAAVAEAEAEPATVLEPPEPKTVPAEPAELEEVAVAEVEAEPATVPEAAEASTRVGADAAEPQEALEAEAESKRARPLALPEQEGAEGGPEQVAAAKPTVLVEQREQVEAAGSARTLALSISMQPAPPAPQVRFALEAEDCTTPPPIGGSLGKRMDGTPGGPAPSLRARGGAPPRPLSLPRQVLGSEDRSYRRVVQQGPDGSVEISKAKSGLRDEDLDWFCEWAKVNLKHNLHRRAASLSVDFSDNHIGDRGCAALVALLHDLQLPVFAVKLYKNQIGDGGAEKLASYLFTNPMHELHLSHNNVTAEGARKLFTSVAGATDERGFPIFPLHVGRRPKPLWLRLENNFLDDGGGPSSVRDLMKRSEQELREMREHLGFLHPDYSDRPIPMLCEVRESYGCSSKGCSQLCPCPRDPGRASGPIAQLPFVIRQKRCERAPPRPQLALTAPEEPCASLAHAPQEAAADFRHEEERPQDAYTSLAQTSRQAATESEAPAAGGGSAAAGDGSDGQAVLRPATAGGDGSAAATVDGSQDIRLSSTAPVPSWVGISGAARRGRQSPQRRAPARAVAGPEEASLEPAPAPVLPVLWRARVVRTVLEQPQGYSPETFLFPLCIGAEVEVLFCDEGGSEGWCWARSRAGQPGWVTSHALLEVGEAEAAEAEARRAEEEAARERKLQNEARRQEELQRAEEKRARKEQEAQERARREREAQESAEPAVDVPFRTVVVVDVNDPPSSGWLTPLPAGTEVEVLHVGQEDDEGWCWARTLSGSSGWVASDKLQEGSPGSPQLPFAPGDAVWALSDGEWRAAKVIKALGKNKGSKKASFCVCWETPPESKSATAIVTLHKLQPRLPGESPRIASS